METYIDGSEVAVCITSADTFWPAFYFIACISLFFLMPFIILLVLYAIIAWNLMGNPGIISHHQNQQPHGSLEKPPQIIHQRSHQQRSNVFKYRKQVIFMLAAVVLSFFLCLLPFRAFTLWIILMPAESIINLGIEGYYILLYFCRIMLYLNSALNPILYNLMSSKFRNGFLKLLGCRTKGRVALKSIDGRRKGTFHTASTNLSSSSSSTRRDTTNPTRTTSVRLRSSGCPEDFNIRRDSATISNRIQMNSNDEISVTNKKVLKRQKSFDDIEELEEAEDIMGSACGSSTIQMQNTYVTPFLVQKNTFKDPNHQGLLSNTNGL